MLQIKCVHTLYLLMLVCLTFISLRKGQDNIANQSIKGNPQGNVGRPESNWKREKSKIKILIKLLCNPKPYRDMDKYYILPVITLKAMTIKQAT